MNKFEELSFKILAAAVATAFGFGFWYTVGWFLTDEINPFLWNWYGKIVYLVFAYTTSTHTLDKLTTITKN